MAVFTNSFSSVGIILPAGATGQVYTLCPKCSHTRKKSKDKCLSVNVEQGVWKCHHTECSWHGSLKRREGKTYRIPDPLPAKMDLRRTDHVYLNADRGLSDNTLMRFKIHSTTKYSKQAEGAVPVLAFPYMRNDVLVNCKYRTANKDFMLEGGAELIFFNIDSLQGQSTCIITEGEFDAMTFYEVGWKEGLVSVPNGVAKKKDPHAPMNLEYLDNCWAHFEGMTKIILATDGDEAGIQLRNELARRFGKDRCMYLKYPEGCKDANDVLIKYGSNAVHNLLDTAKLFPIDGVYTVEDYEKDVDNLFHNGIERGKDTGFFTFDEHFLHRRGEVTVVTGIPNSGKSRFEDQLSMRLAAKHGWRTAFCSFEKQPPMLHIGTLASIFTGRPFFGDVKGKRKMDIHEFTEAKQFIQDHFFFFNFQNEEITIDSIIKKAITLVRTRGLEKLVIDPYNYLLSGKPSNMNEADYILYVLNKLLHFAKNYDVSVVIVAHPTKQQKGEDGKYLVPNLYSISGSAHWYNAVDNGYTVYRDFENNSVQIYILKVRWEFVGKVGMIPFHYDVASGMYAEQGLDHIPDIRYYHRRIGIAI